MRKTIKNRFFLIALSLLLLIGLTACSSPQSKSETIEKAPKTEMKSETVKKTPQKITNEELPNVSIIATGGTIAGVAASDTQTTGYKAGEVAIETLLDAVPEVKEIANITGTQLVNIDSSAMTNEILLKLAKEVNKQLASDSVDGIVITHGTDTIEETAYFLNLVVKSEKPVVLVGAMRPSTAISADGPLNLYNAVAIAASPDSKGHGVMIELNEKIGSARDTTKLNTTAVNSFDSFEYGDIGNVQGSKPYFYNKPSRIHTSESKFDISNVTELPKVEILYGHGNDSRILVDAAVKGGAKGIIHAGTGNGSVFPETQEGLVDAQKKGVVIVRASRVATGMVTHEVTDDTNKFVTSDSLNPAKARILLMLALLETSDPVKIQSYFDNY
ncbi:L-asparaginase 2 [Neobacillus rhizosphaerae]|uniref:asparaginase n=1 Tax=Neobacillus rhizosphaerae TaxID=2880965 RepID=A0ABM9EQ82_9BACI|nr:type II asparaginase [Neobacillus rhizosphaerae]CAH2714772.1 L-asparaginase 2 [Neobacillus rhizosphaerae]